VVARIPVPAPPPVAVVVGTEDDGAGTCCNTPDAGLRDRREEEEERSSAIGVRDSNREGVAEGSRDMKHPDDDSTTWEGNAEDIPSPDDDRAGMPAYRTDTARYPDARAEIGPSYCTPPPSPAFDGNGVCG
jgi:hypothetical protein